MLPPGPHRSSPLGILRLTLALPSLTRVLPNPSPTLPRYPFVYSKTTDGGFVLEAAANPTPTPTPTPTLPLPLPLTLNLTLTLTLTTDPVPNPNQVS